MKIKIYVDGKFRKEVESAGELPIVEEVARALRFINIYMECVEECIGIDDWKKWFGDRLEKAEGEENSFLYTEEEEGTEYLFEIERGEK